MGTWIEAFWESTVTSGLPRRDRRSGHYRSYLPDHLVGAPLVLPPELDVAVAAAERAVRAISPEAAPDLAGVARFLLRSEAIASSQIEGIAPSVNQVALAELGRDERVPDLSEQAQLVANNMTVVRQARRDLADTDSITIEHLEHLQRALLPAAPPEHQGVRQLQNWIGGSDHHPLEAEFVPPSPDEVPGLLEDLAAYMNGAAHSPIVQAGLTHAQFETIHPFTDGNGRVGRALIHTILTRRGLTTHSVLPVSMVLATLRDRYVEGLTAFRHGGEVGSEEFHAARAAWLAVFTDAVLVGAQQASSLAGDLAELRLEWEQQLAEARARQGKEKALRSDSATALILRDLPSSPVLTVATAQRIHHVSHVAAGRALDELANAGILGATSRSGRQYYQAQSLLELVTLAQRRLASARFDTRISAPIRPVPALWSPQVP